MSNQVNLKELERQVYTTYQEDGVWDIFLGLGLLLGGIGMIFDLMIFLGPIYGVMVAVMASAFKKAFTVPRIGYVKFAPSRRIKMQRSALLSLLANILAFLVVLILVVSRSRDHWIAQNFEIVFGVFIAVIMCAIGYMLAINRLYAYAGLTLVAFIGGGGLLDIEFPFVLAALGAVVLVAGLGLMARFIHKYPVVPQEGFDGNR